MLRIIAGIVVGFIVMFVLVMASFAATMVILGADGTFQPNSYWTTNTFNITVLVGGFVAAIVGGLVCMVIARRTSAAYGLAAILVVMGIGSFLMNMNKPEPPPRTAQMTMVDISQHGKEPTWFAVAKSVAGVIGVLIGASMIKKRPPSTA